ncbi:MAG: hypothetical protein NT120_05000 [Candidatus Aenigmarchaeota archaeon]|nr:hypothetical protein [Candidatus Aenigmarchaeota archaeon]
MKPESLEKYRKIQEKFDLPRYNDLKATFKFDVENFESIDQIRSEISDKLFSLSERVIEHIIVGGESYCCLFEQDMVTQEERQSMFEIYKKLQVLKWENNLLSIKPNEKKTGEWIRKTWDLWNSDIESEMTKICKKLSVAWSDLRFKEEKIHYSG